jgi:hypothetical protein
MAESGIIFNAIPPKDRPSNIVMERVNNKAIDSDVAHKRVYLLPIDSKGHSLACAAPIVYDINGESYTVTCYPLSDEELIDACEQRCVFCEPPTDMSGFTGGVVPTGSYTEPYSWGYVKLATLDSTTYADSTESVAYACYKQTDPTLALTGTGTAVVMGYNTYMAELMPENT